MIKQKLFNPFIYQSELEQFYNDTRREDAAEVFKLLLNYRLAAISGKSGFGKTTFLKSTLKQIVQENNFDYFYVNVPLSANIDMLIDEYNNACGEAGYSRFSQSVGNIDKSSEVEIKQILVVNNNLTAFLSNLAKKTKCVIVFDQFDRLLESSYNDALNLIEKLLNFIEKKEECYYVFCLKETYLGEFISIVNDTRSIYFLKGLDCQKAQEFIMSVDANHKLFAENIISDIVHSLYDKSSGVWPLGLIAVCALLEENKQYLLAEINFAPENLIALTIENMFPLYENYSPEDYVLALSIIGHKNSLSFADIEQYFPIRSHDWLNTLLMNLVSIKLLQKNRFQGYLLVHESISLGVKLLQKKYPRIEEIVGLGNPDILKQQPIDIEQITNFLDYERIPLPTLFLIVIILFDNDNILHENDDILKKLGSCFRRYKEQEIIDYFEISIAASSERNFSFEACLAILFIDSREKLILHALISISTAVQKEDVHYTEWRIVQAMLLTKQNVIANVFEKEINNLNDLFPIRIVLEYSRVCHEIKKIKPEIIYKLWQDYPLLKPELLQHVDSENDLSYSMLREGLNAANPVLRSAAVTALSAFENWHKEYIADVLSKEKDISIRRRAVYSMVNLLGDPAFQALFKETWRKETSPLVKEAMIETINDSRQPQYRDILIEATHDPIDFVRESAVFALFDIYKNDAMPEEIIDLYADHSAKVKDAMIKCYGFPNNKTFIEYAHDLKSLPVSLQIEMVDKSVLYNYSEEIIINILNDIQFDDKVIAKALQVVAEIRNEKCAYYAARFLKNPNIELVCYAIVAVQNGIKSVENKLQLLKPLIKHPSLDVRERLIYALGELYGSDAENTIIDCLFDSNESLRTKAIYALAKLKSIKAKPIIKLLNGSDALQEAKSFYFNNINTP